MIKGISGLFNSGLSICDLTSLLFTTVAFMSLTVESMLLPPLLLFERVAIDDSGYRSDNEVDVSISGLNVYYLMASFIGPG